MLTLVLSAAPLQPHMIVPTLSVVHSAAFGAQLELLDRRVYKVGALLLDIISFIFYLCMTDEVRSCTPFSVKVKYFLHVSYHRLCCVTV